MMRVEEAVGIIAAERGDALAVLTMSALALWTDVREDDYRLLGLMGGAGSIGLGLALGRPERTVMVVDGDGSLLMALGVLAAIADAAPANLVHVVIDNGVYAVSGAQPTPGTRDWVGLFTAAGYRDAAACATPRELRAALSRHGAGPRGIAVRCSAERPAYPAGAFSFDPAHEAARVRAALAAGRGQPPAAISSSSCSTSRTS
jgi:phosphonopyruvate decarboxylase